LARQRYGALADISFTFLTVPGVEQAADLPPSKTEPAISRLRWSLTSNRAFTALASRSGANWSKAERKQGCSASQWCERKES
jgi:hypothetical protein